MKNSLFFKHVLVVVSCIFLSGTVNAQSNHAVEVSSNKFEPKELTVQVGDTVTWTNISGNHNVNGTQTTFANNPESFGNDVDSDWTFNFVFNSAGTYDYQCDPHVGFGMVGKVIVQGETTSLIHQSYTLHTSIYPNPVDNRLNIVLDDPNIRIVDLSIYNVVGLKVIGLAGMKSNDSEINIQVASLQAGFYILNVQSGNKQSTLRFMKK